MIMTRAGIGKVSYDSPLQIVFGPQVKLTINLHDMQDAEEIYQLLMTHQKVKGIRIEGSIEIDSAGTHHWETYKMLD